MIDENTERRVYHNTIFSLNIRSFEYKKIKICSILSGLVARSHASLVYYPKKKAFYLFGGSGYHCYFDSTL